MSTMHLILSAFCIGITNIFVEWFIIGVLFHKVQSLTPQTWRAENKSSYMYSTALSFLFGALFTFFYVKIGWHYVLRENILSACKLGLICFGCFAFILESGNAIYINYDRKFMAGKMISLCITYLSAAIIACLFNG